MDSDRRSGVQILWARGDVTAVTAERSLGDPMPVTFSDRWVQIARALPPAQLSVALWIATSGGDRDRMLEGPRGEMVLTKRGSILASQREIAVAVGVSRQVVRDAMAALLRARLIVAERHGVATDPWLITPVGVDKIGVGSWTHRHDRVENPRDHRLSIRFDDSFEARVSGENPREIGENPRENPRISDDDRVAENPREIPRGNAGSTGAAQPVGDGRSSESSSSVATSLLTRDVAQRDLFSGSRPPTAPVPADPGTETPTPRSALRTPRGGRAKTRRPEMPPQALAAADLLRDEILRAQPGHQIRRRDPWETNALRHQWARDLDVMARLDGRAWQEIDAMIRWVWNGQTGEYRFEAESPDALRRKWDRIARAMGRGTAGNDEIPAFVTDRRTATVSEDVDLAAPITRG